MQKTTYDIVAFLVVTTLLVLLMAGFVLTILFLYRKKQAVYQREMELIKADFEKNLLNTRLEIQEQTLQSIAREIHDNINLSLTLAKLNLNTLDILNPQSVQEKIASTIEFVSKAISDLSDISRSMNSEVITEQGLISALELETEKLRKLDWFIVQFEITGDPVYMEAQKELFIFRIVQEAYNNILKHAYAGHVMLSIHYEKNRVEITVTDDGRGFDKNSRQENIPKNPSAGLLNMQKRADLLNGKCFIDSSPGKGTRIYVTIPF